MVKIYSRTIFEVHTAYATWVICLSNTVLEHVWFWIFFNIIDALQFLDHNHIVLNHMVYMGLVYMIVWFRTKWSSSWKQSDSTCQPATEKKKRITYQASIKFVFSSNYQRILYAYFTNYPLQIWIKFSTIVRFFFQKNSFSIV